MNLRDIKLRIRSVRKTQQITRAMKMVAAVKFRRAQARLLSARPYAGRLRELAARALRGSDPETAPALLRPRPAGRMLLVIVASDKGLCGSFNHNVARAAQRFIREETGSAAALDVWLIGRKINDAFKHWHAPAQPAFSIFRYTPQAEADGAAIGGQLIGLFEEGRYSRIEGFYSQFKSAMQSQVVRETLLPLEAARLAGTERPAAPADVLAEPVLPEILADLLPRLLLVQVRQMLLESEAAEQGTRMTMMDQATKNADDLIGQLMQDFNKARQWSITRELTDITTGVEAMA
jgi:F-type H+-transporting ATPase subunit gamma